MLDTEAGDTRDVEQFDRARLSWTCAQRSWGGVLSLHHSSTKSESARAAEAYDPLFGERRYRSP